MPPRPRSLLPVLAWALAWVCACAGDDGAEPGGELGPCVQGRFCEQPLVCIEGICVHPDQVADEGSFDDDDDGGSAEDGSSRLDMGGGTSMPGDDGGGDATAGGAEIYCTTESESGGCFCGHTADYGPLGEPCSESTVPAPGHCCASEGWPSYGGCSCWSLSCRRISYDTCYCGIGLVDAEDEPVAACTPDGGICCRGADATCACWTSLTACPPDEEPVASCSVADLGCGDSTRVTACN